MDGWILTSGSKYWQAWEGPFPQQIVSVSDAWFVACLPLPQLGFVLVCCCSCNKCQKTGSLKWHTFITSQCWRSKVQNGSHWAQRYLHLNPWDLQICYRLGKRNFVDMIELRILKSKDYPGLSSGLEVIMRVLIRGRQEGWY